MPALFPTRAFRRTRERASGLLFAFGVDDLSTTLTTGQSLSLTRATGRTVVDSTGRVATIVHSQYPWSSVYNSAESVWEPTLDVRPQTTNLCLRSEDFGTTWAAIGTPTRTAAAKAIGQVSLDLIGDDAAGTLEGYSQVTAFTGNAVKTVSLVLAAGTSTSTVLRLRDTTASANRLLATIAWSAGVPTVTMTTGTNIGTIAMANGGYRFQFQTTSVTAANTNQLEVYPATTSALAVANTGTVYAGGVQVENAVAPGPYNKTLGSTVTSNRDLLSASVTLPLSDFTVYLRIARPHWAGLTTGWPGDFGLFGPATAVTYGSWALYFDPVGQNMRSLINQAGSGAFASQAIPATPFMDVCAQFTGITSAPKTRIDVGGGFSAYSSTIAPISQWESATTYLGGDASSSAGASIRKAIIAPGLRTLAEMRGLNV